MFLCMLYMYFWSRFVSDSASSITRFLELHHVVGVLATRNAVSELDGCGRSIVLWPPGPNGLSGDKNLITN
jgi:hypothetical protein